MKDKVLTTRELSALLNIKYDTLAKYARLNYIESEPASTCQRFFKFSDFEKIKARVDKLKKKNSVFFNNKNSLGKKRS